VKCISLASLRCCASPRRKFCGFPGVLKTQASITTKPTYKGSKPRSGSHTLTRVCLRYKSRPTTATSIAPADTDHSTNASMAPLTHTSFDDWTLASLYPRPVFLLTAGSVLLLALLLRRCLTSRRSITYGSDTKVKQNDEGAFSDLPPPLRSKYHHKDGSEAFNKTSSVLAREATMRQLHMPVSTSSPIASPSEKQNRRHSCPHPTAPVDDSQIIDEPLPYTQLLHHSVNFYPVHDDDSETNPGERYWRRRTLVYG
jgi:hypothetical protein